MKTIAFENYDQWVLLAHGNTPPSNEDWGAYVEFLQAAEHTAKGLLVLTAGEGPDSLQRKRVSSIQIRTAVTTSSRLGRGIVTALGWLGADIRAFSPHQLDDALIYLGVPEAGKGGFAHKLLQLRLEVMGDPPSSNLLSYDQTLQAIQASLERETTSKYEG